MSLLKSHLWPACRLPYPHPRPQTSTNVSSNIAPLAAPPSHPPPGPSPGPGHHDHPRLWLLGALSSQKVRLSLCSAADCAKHIEYEGFRPQPFQNSRKSTVFTSLSSGSGVAPWGTHARARGNAFRRHSWGSNTPRRAAKAARRITQWPWGRRGEGGVAAPP